MTSIRNKLPFLLLRHFIFWMFVFTIMRSVFLVWNHEELGGIPFSQYITVYFHGFYLDTAMAAYMIIPAFLLLSVSMFLQKEWPLRVNRIVSVILIVISLIIMIADLQIYDEWHIKLNYKAIWFLGDPSEVYHTASLSQILIGIPAITLFTWLFYKMFKRISSHMSIPDRKPILVSILAFFLSTTMIVYGIRGGFSGMPIQVSDAYFSTKNILNVTSVNTTFNLMSSIIENSRAGKAYAFIPKSEMDSTMKRMYAVPKDTTIHVLTTTKPNVVLVVLEGWSADGIKGCGGYDSITPFFDEMSQSGILFSNLFASGSLSDQGMAAIFSAFPAQPKTSIITQPAKYVHLPSINTCFKKAGYHTSYMFAGQLSYGNIRSYMYYNAFDRIKEDKDMDPSFPRVKLGIPDEYLFTTQLNDLKTEQEPFFAGMFTLSTHAPYDTPMPSVFNWGGKENDYINAMHYSDNCIRNFITEAKKQTWYANTLFVFVSDHSHNSPKNWAFNQPEYRHMPMLFFGDVIKPEFRGKKYEQVASQTDLASTLLHQLDMDATEFHYSKNLFNPYSPHFAFYTFDEGFGYVIADNSHMTWSTDGRKEYVQENTPGDELKMLQEGKAMLQYLSEEYARY